LSSARELAYVLGKERAFAQVVGTAIAEGRAELRGTPDNSTFAANTAALCALAEPAVAKGCLAKVAALPRELTGLAETTELIDAGERYIAGDFRGAAERARALANLVWFRTRIGDFLVDVFDRGGMPEMAEELDRPHVDDKVLHGASLATLRSARRAWARGDKARARELARRVVEAWKLVDTTVPAVAEMEALLAKP
jgi:hypothetical protein